MKARICLGSLCVGLLSACGSPADLGGGRESVLASAGSVEDGPLAQRVAQLQASSSAGCERTLFDDAMTVARALDAREAEIDAYVDALPPSDAYTRIQMGPIVVKERRIPPTSSLGWQTGTYGWPESIALYQEVQDEPVDLSWVELNSYVRSHIMLDFDRLVLGYSEGAYLARRDLPILGEATNAVATCLADSSCTTPQFGAEAAALIARHPLYALLGADRASLMQLRPLLERDLATSTLVENLSVEVDFNGDIVLPLNPGPFRDVTDQLEAYAITPWANESRRLRIKWTAPGQEDETLYSLVAGATGTRSSVDRETKIIRLSSDFRASAIPHEFGHVLGFPDMYYTSWNPQACRYVEEFSQEEIMSDDSTGVVTAADWAALEELYPTR